MEVSISGRGYSSGWLAVSLAFAACGGGTSGPEPAATVRLSGHGVAALATAEKLAADPAAPMRPILLTVVLEPTDAAGFHTFAAAVRDPASAQFRHFAAPAALADRFGPSEDRYEAVLAFLTQAGFTLSRGSKNRLTLTVLGTRAQAEEAFAVQIADYQANGRTFFASDQAPAVPASLPIHAVIGLTDYYRPAPLVRKADRVAPSADPAVGSAPNWSPVALAQAYDFGGVGATGAGQTVGLIEFADYEDADVTNYLAYAGLPASQASQVTRVEVAGGSSDVDTTPEVDLDIDAVLGAAPGANVTVFVAENGTSFETMLNEVVDEGIDIVSNSWGYCEGDDELGDASSIDVILESAAATGLSVYSAAGDNGGSCVDVPADSPHGIAVGGTTLYVNGDGSYQSESYWDDNGGAGGFGISSYFAEPSFQQPFGTLSGRSVPDVAASADPMSGIEICILSNCPDGPYGGTSLAAPLWAAGTALLDQQLGYAIGNLNGSLYAEAGTSALHSPANMNAGDNDFANLGIGSFDLGALAAALGAQGSGSSGGSSSGASSTAQGGSGAGSSSTAASSSSSSGGSSTNSSSSGGPIGGSSSGLAGGSPGNGPAPTVISISPDSGTAGGGTAVTLKGTVPTDAPGQLMIDFGGVASPTGSCTQQGTSLSCTATSPPGSGTVDVTIVFNGQSSPPVPADQFTYVAAPAVTALGPATGPATGGTLVTLTGTGFSTAAGATKIYFGSIASASVKCSATTQCTAVAPAEQATVHVTADVAGQTSSPGPANLFTFVLAPVVTAVVPNAGAAAGGTSVTVTGANLTSVLGPTSLTFGGKAATAVSCASANQCTATSPAGVGPVAVLVNAGGQSSASVAADKFTYYGAPTVTAVSPKGGALAGGTRVTVTGTNLSTPLGPTAITFGGAPAASVSCVSSAECTALSPAGTAGAVDVVVAAGSQSSSIVAADKYTYFAAPAVTGVSPAQGPAGGGTRITITGTGLTNAVGTTTVTVDGKAATGVSCASGGGQCTAVTPPGSGTGDVLVAVAGQPSAAVTADEFTYVAAPSIALVSPSAGPAAGGTVVTITGANLTSVLGVTAIAFGGRAATGVSCASANQCTATTPSGSGLVAVTVTAGQSSAAAVAARFTFVAAPSISTVTPKGGSLAGGTLVTIAGSNLTSVLGPTSLTFGGVAATGVSCASASRCTATSPAGTGTVAVQVTAGGQSSSTALAVANEFTFAAAPVVTGVSPATGPATGGTKITITGTNLTNAAGTTSVTVGGRAASSVSCASSSQCTAVTPTGSGTTDVLVTVLGQTSTAVTADQFTF